MGNNQEREIVPDIYYFQTIMKLSYSDANEAYEALANYDGDMRYNIALGYLSMSQQSHLELMRIYRENEFDHYEIESYFKAYDHYNFQLKQVITDKDENISWLIGAQNDLIEAWKNTDDFLTNWAKHSIKQ